MRPLLTARRLSAYATTPEEQELSRQAERLADHALDLAFVVAMRDAAESTPDQTPELRARAEAQLGAKFDLRRFHDAVLGQGSVPLDVLEAQIADWIAVEKQR